MSPETTHENISRFSFPDMDEAKRTFGDNAAIYGTIINQILPNLFRGGFHFEENHIYERLASDELSGIIYAGHKYWQEILYRAHMSSVAAIFRTTRWVDVAVREQNAGNLFGWASACRSLIESSGDINFSLNAVPLSLAELSEVINLHMNGEVSGSLSVAAELEDDLIHFMYGRKIPKNADFPQSHQRRSSAEYVERVEKMKIDGVKELYADLCEIVHPAASSVEIFFRSRGSVWRTDPKGELNVLNKRIAASQKTMGDVLMASYNPPLLTLKVIRHFRLLSGYDFMDKYEFHGLPIWQKILSTSQK
ncbi:hypothetical protein RQ744_06650 [Roseomonas mucosa]|uniref:hypothetical protein n=1 Tax=Roseomonas TaxID=125216 RepID=UPI0012FACB04|nr:MULTISPECIES: hypothetical protein [Roseomonas]MCG7354532.1 hypothetical protein [Roseomonas mucosa]MCG7358409.1 hypothetical protein [Roseomonas mucosa]MDT8293648.1 hypothetical protein [Roseomonas mucosa]